MKKKTYNIGDEIKVSPKIHKSLSESLKNLNSLRAQIKKILIDIDKEEIKIFNDIQVIFPELKNKSFSFHHDRQTIEVRGL